ncbi:hypothetical protein ZTR_04635 [Talaromyces verruculosus]|nr:hypothetical protein ZTR_04635 [Talaromyces verruculosus]
MDWSEDFHRDVADVYNFRQIENEVIVDRDAINIYPSESENEQGAGSVPEWVNLYNHSTGPRPIWSEKQDLIFEEARLREFVAPYAIVHRQFKKGTGIDQHWETQSIEIQSKRLRNCLDAVFQDYINWNSGPEPYTFQPPFQQFFHRWKELKAAYASHSDELALEEMKILLKYLIPRMDPFKRALEEIERVNTVSFEDLWLIFPPGELVVSDNKGTICISRVRDGYQDVSQNNYVLEMEQIDWNGRCCGFLRTVGVLKKFSGPCRISSLAIHPLRFTSDKKNIEAIALARGKKFEALRGFSVRKCIGKKYVSVRNEEELVVEKMGRPVSGRVIIDAYAFYTRQDVTLPSIREDPERTPSSPSSTSENADDQPRRRPAETERKEDLRTLTDLECMLAVPRVRDFDLMTKQWCEFNVDEIHDPAWSSEPFDMLVLPEGEKELILALTNRDRLMKGIFNDVVQRRDRGIIFLLCGPPGVGKTLTAEALADKFKIPLYILAANDIGTSAQKVETALQDAFECCRLWDALLLIDEADVYLATRQSDHLTRNELVAVFLRQIELYHGLMFLTTNRVEAIDDAFQSRMDLIFRYPSLDKAARRQVWERFLGILGPGNHEITDSDLDEIAKSELNGREIKNAIKTAYVLASDDGRLTMSHLQIVLGVRNRLASS